MNYREKDFKRLCHEGGNLMLGIIAKNTNDEEHILRRLVEERMLACYRPSPKETYAKEEAKKSFSHIVPQLDALVLAGYGIGEPRLYLCDDDDLLAYTMTKDTLAYEVGELNLYLVDASFMNKDCYFPMSGYAVEW